MLKNLKILLGIPESDTSQDDKLNLILSGTTSRLKALLGGQDQADEQRTKQQQKFHLSAPGKKFRRVTVS